MNRRLIDPVPGYAGMEGSIEGTKITLLNASTELPQKNQVTIGTATPEIEYAINIDSYTATYTSTTTDTASNIGANLAAAVNIAGLGVYAIASSTTGDIELVGTNGKPFSIYLSGGDAGFVASPLQAAAESSPIEFGKLIVTGATDKINVGRLPSDPVQRIRGISTQMHKGQEHRLGLGARYENTEPMCVKVTGSIWVEFEGEADITQPINYRFAAQGDLTELGGFTSTSDAGTAPLPSSSFLHVDGRLAEILINLLS